MTLKGVFEFLHRWQWLIGGSMAVLPTVYYGPRKILETWDWYVHLVRDEPLLQIMRDRKLVPAKYNIAIEQQIGPKTPLLLQVALGLCLPPLRLLPAQAQIDGDIRLDGPVHSRCLSR